MALAAAPARGDVLRLGWRPVTVSGLAPTDPLNRVVQLLGKGDTRTAREVLTPLLVKSSSPALAHELEGYLLVQEGNLRGGEAAFKKSLSLLRGPRVANAALGETLFLQRRFNEAEREFVLYLESKPDDGRAHGYLGRIAVQNANVPRAVLHFERALAAGGETTDEARFQLASLYVAQRDLRKAKDLLAKCVQACASSAGYAVAMAQVERAENRADAAEARLNAFVARDKSSPDVWLELAAVHRVKRNPAAAERALIEAAKSPAAMLASRLEAAGLALSSGDVARATTILSELVDKKSGPEAYVLLSQAHAMAGRHAEAGRTLNAVVSEFPGYSQGHLALGLWHLGQKQTAPARKALSDAVRIQPDLVQGWIHLANLESVAHRTAEAERLLRQGLKAAPKNPDLFYHLGLELEMQNRWTDAAKAYAEALTLAPGFPAAMTNRARMLVRSGGDLAEAEKLMREVLAALPKDPLAQGNLGWVLVNRGQVKEGVPHLEAAAGAMPTNPELQYFLSVAYGKLGRTKDAAARLQLARQHGLPADYGKAH